MTDAHTQGEIIRRHLLEFSIGRWINGSTDRQDRPTLADLEEVGYRVVRSDDARSIPRSPR